MSSLDALTGTGVYAKEPGGVSAGPASFVEATVATTPTAVDEEVMVLVGAEGSQLQAGPCRWEPRTGGQPWPRRDDPCLVVTGDKGHRALVWWKPATSAALVVSSLPDLPHDGQEILFQTQAMAVDGVPPWRFRYRASNPDGSPNTDAFRWDAVGVSSWMSTALSGFTPTTNGNDFAHAQLATDGKPAITVPLAGEYDFTAEFKNNGGPAGTLIAWLTVNGAWIAPANVLHGANYVSAFSVPAGDFSGAFTRRGRIKLAAGDVVTVRYSAGSVGGSVAERFLELKPHRAG